MGCLGSKGTIPIGLHLPPFLAFKKWFWTIESWLFNGGDPDFMVYYQYNRVAAHPLHNLNKQPGLIVHCSNELETSPETSQFQF